MWHHEIIKVIKRKQRSIHVTSAKEFEPDLLLKSVLILTCVFFVPGAIYHDKKPIKKNPIFNSVHLCWFESSSGSVGHEESIQIATACHLLLVALKNLTFQNETAVFACKS